METLIALYKISIPIVFRPIFQFPLHLLLNVDGTGMKIGTTLHLYQIFVFPEINECAPDPCVHGTCQDQVNDYECTCDAGFTGTNCETGMYIMFFILENSFYSMLNVIQ